MRTPRLGIGLGSLLVALLIVAAVGIGSAIAVIPDHRTYYACLTNLAATTSRLRAAPRYWQLSPGPVRGHQSPATVRCGASTSVKVSPATKSPKKGRASDRTTTVVTIDP
jgi:hypothetical protein